MNKKIILAFLVLVLFILYRRTTKSGYRAGGCPDDGSIWTMYGCQSLPTILDGQDMSFI